MHDLIPKRFYLSVWHDKLNQAQNNDEHSPKSEVGYL
jgi:hypothetical protein